MFGLYLFPTATTATVCSANAASTQSVPYFGPGRTHTLGVGVFVASTVVSFAFVITIELRAEAENYLDQNNVSLRK